MYRLILVVCKHTADEPEVITDHNTIMELAGLNIKNGYKGIALQEDGPGIVMDNKGHYGELRHGYFVSYSERPVPLEE